MSTDATPRASTRVTAFNVQAPNVGGNEWTIEIRSWSRTVHTMVVHDDDVTEVWELVDRWCADNGYVI